MRCLEKITCLQGVDVLDWWQNKVSFERQHSYSTFQTKAHGYLSLECSRISHITGRVFDCLTDKLSSTLKPSIPAQICKVRTNIHIPLSMSWLLRTLRNLYYFSFHFCFFCLHFVVTHLCSYEPNHLHKAII